MKNFAIKTPDAEIRTALQQKIDGDNESSEQGESV